MMRNGKHMWEERLTMCGVYCECLKYMYLIVCRILDFLHSPHVDGEKSSDVASLLFADFPTNFKVENFSENEVCILQNHNG